MRKAERRSEVSQAERALIRETAVLVHEQTYQKLVATPLTERLLAKHEPEIAKELRVTFPNLLTRPRRWIKELLATIGQAHFVRIYRVPINRREMGIRIVGKAHDVMLAERTVQRTLMFAREYADVAYKNRDGIVPGSRKKWLSAFVAYEQAALGSAYESLAAQFGYDRLEAIVGGFDHVQLPAVALPEVRALRAGTG
jgi:hypothetical protein